LQLGDKDVIKFIVIRLRVGEVIKEGRKMARNKDRE
jgi:hypothetical protein